MWCTTRRAVPKYLLAVSEVPPSDLARSSPTATSRWATSRRSSRWAFLRRRRRRRCERPRATCRARPRRSRAMLSGRGVDGGGGGAVDALARAAHLPAAERRLYTEGVVMAQPGWLRESRRRYTIAVARVLGRDRRQQGRFKAHYPLEMLARLRPRLLRPRHAQLALADGWASASPSPSRSRPTAPAEHRAAARRRPARLDARDPSFGLRARLPSSATPDAEPPSELLGRRAATSRARRSPRPTGRSCSAWAGWAASPRARRSPPASATATATAHVVRARGAGGGGRGRRFRRLLRRRR